MATKFNARSYRLPPAAGKIAIRYAANRHVIRCRHGWSDQLVSFYSQTKRTALMRQSILAAFTLGFVVAVGGCGGYDDVSKVHTSTPEATVTAADLIKAYADDFGAADQKYKGKIIVVDGYVESLPADPELPTINIDADPSGTKDFNCAVRRLRLRQIGPIAQSQRWRSNQNQGNLRRQNGQRHSPRRVLPHKLIL